MGTLALVAFIGFLAGGLAGMLGVGGGIVFVPAVTIGLGLSQLHAEATSLLAIIPTVLAGSLLHHQYGNVRWRPAVAIGLAALAGVEAGVQIAIRLPEHVLQRLFAVLLLAVAAQIVWRAVRGRAQAAGERG